MRWILSPLICLAMVCSGFVANIAAPATAQASASSVQPGGEDMVTADALPTAQINGVAWDQEVVGNTVFVGGSFSQARPAGAAPGISQTPRANLMSYSLSTGNMTSWNPGANAQIRTVTASPDGSRIYVGGDFTQIGGQSRSRIAAFSTASGQLVGSFAPPVGYQVNDIAVTDTTVYVGGSFAGVGSESRANLAAFSAANGALLGWAPSTERQVRSLDVTEDGSSVIVGGNFETVNGAPIRGLAKIDAVDGSLEPWATPISNAGADAAVTSVRVDGDVLFGTSFHFGPGGNVEGPWQVDVETGALVWVADCHGDNYDTFASAAGVYTVGHPHYCGNVSMGFPQYNPWRYQHSMAWTRDATGTNIREVHGYASWDGEPSPSIMNWLPSMSIGSYTGQYQAGWTVEGNDEYVVVGGEFPRVNNTGQQGLVRFATASKAPQNRGPEFAGGALVPTLEAVAPGSVKVSWPAGYDMDDHELTYQVVRSPGGIVHEVSQESTWWDTPGMAYVDQGLTPGANYRYSIRARDASNNVVFGSSRTIDVPSSFTRDDYGTAVLADDPEIYWPLDESAGATRTSDQAGGYYGVPGSNVTFGVDGAIPGRTAVRSGNNNNARIYAEGVSHAPTEMSAEIWFRSGSGSGRILGFGDLQTGNSGHRDRQIYLADNGRVNFGVRAGGTRVVSSSQQYNDNEWHQAVATLSDNSARLYVDGVLVGQRHDLEEPEEYVGHWRLGGDNQSGWPQAGNNNFDGDLDEMSIYDRAMTPAEVDAHYVASGRSSNIPDAPEDEYGAAVFDLEPSLYWRLNDTAGTTAEDSGVTNNDGLLQGGFTLGEEGALVDVDNDAVGVNGSDGRVSSTNAETNPLQFSTEAWFKTTTTRGGKIIGFGNSQTSLSNNYDRHTVMQNNGTLAFGVWTGRENLATSPLAYNDGQWHHVVSSLSPDGMQLFVDGELVGTNANVDAQDYVGYWKVGGDRVWGGASSNYFEGAVDEVAVYARPLTAEQVQEHYVTGSGNVPNVAPKARFAHSVDDLLVSFDGSESSDEDGDVETYEWDFGDGSSGSGATTSHSYAEGGTYDVVLTVTDDDGASDTSTEEVSVAANQAPTAEFTSEVTDLMVSLDASTSMDDDGQIESYSWDFGDGESGSGVTASHTFQEGGSYDITLTVTDDDGESSEVTQSVTVAPAPANTAPTAAFESTVTNLQVATDASASTDDDGEIVAYSWDFGDGTTETGLTAAHTYSEAGTFTVTLTVTDDDGDNDTSSEEVTVEAPPQNQAPVAAFDVSPVDLSVSVDGGSSTDTDGTIESYAWDFGDGATATGATASNTYASAGTYDITLVVTDDDGAETSLSESVTVTAPQQNQAPEAAFTSSIAGLTAAFDSAGSIDPDGSIEAYAWTFGDDETSTQASPTHTYASAGTYEVTLTVTDDSGESDTASEQVTVSTPPPANEAPEAEFESSTQGLSVQLDGSSSSDSDGTVETYSWDLGDGSGEQGPTVSHTYQAAGSYDVTLTVVDDDGATDSVTKEVTVSVPQGGQSFASDTFGRQVNNGFGSADLGGVWSTTNTSSLFGVSNGAGRMTMPRAGSGVTQALEGVSARDVEATVDLAFDKPSSATGIYGTLIVRRDGGDSYRLRARAMPTGTMVLLTRTVNGAETVLDNTTLPWVYQPGEVIRMRMTAEGNGTTALNGKIWRVGDAEPASWQVVADDSTAALQAPGAVGVYTYLSGSSTNAPVVASVDNLHLGESGAQAPPNAAPVAAFSSLSDGLELQVDGSSSSDLDGSVESFAWSFGDGSSASGETATHTYGAPGVYDVSLTATDNDGAEHTVNREVTITAEGENVAPVATFEFDVSDLDVSVDATGSTDQDGIVESYEWDFGDDSTETGSTAEHTYDAAGTYEVTLTVTDDAGGQDVARQDVTVSEPADPGAVATDAFERTEASGFGTADVGGVWTGSTRSTSVNNGTGFITMANPGSGPRLYLEDVSAQQVGGTVDFSLDKEPQGDVYVTVAARRIGDSEYRVRARLRSDSTMLMLTRVVNGTQTTLAYETLPDMAFTQGDTFRMRVQAVGQDETTLSGKLWRAGQPEPSAWQVESTDDAAALQAPGGVGLGAYLSGSATNAPVVARFDALELSDASE